MSEDDLWVKIVGMLEQNWAYIEHTDRGSHIIFVSDFGEMFDEIAVDSVAEANAALKRNGFRRFSDERNLRDFVSVPERPFRNGEHWNGQIYSSGRFWK
jgi:hypothetical protein